MRSCCADAWNNSVPTCPLCQEPMSVWHVCWQCPVTQQSRRNDGFSQGVEECARRGQGKPLFTPAIIPHPADLVPPPLTTPRMQWSVVVGHEPLFLGHVFGDWSGLNPVTHLTRRCGWAVAGTVSVMPLRNSGRRRSGSAGVALWSLPRPYARGSARGTLFSAALSSTRDPTIMESVP